MGAWPCHHWPVRAVERVTNFRYFKRFQDHILFSQASSESDRSIPSFSCQIYTIPSHRLKMDLKYFEQVFPKEMLVWAYETAMGLVLPSSCHTHVFVDADFILALLVQHEITCKHHQPEIDPFEMRGSDVPSASST